MRSGALLTPSCPVEGRPGGGQEEMAMGSRAQIQRGPSIDTRADPVMSADKTLSFKVTLADFLAQAHEVFASLDILHNGLIGREAVLATCDGAAKAK